MVADRSVQCQTKSDGVWTTTVEKADAGTLDQCQGSLVFPLHTKQRLSERRSCSHVIKMENLPQQVSEAPHSWRHVYCIPLRLDRKGNNCTVFYGSKCTKCSSMGSEWIWWVLSQIMWLYFASWRTAHEWNDSTPVHLREPLTLRTSLQTLWVLTVSERLHAFWCNSQHHGWVSSTRLIYYFIMHINHA